MENKLEWNKSGFGVAIQKVIIVVEGRNDC